MMVGSNRLNLELRACFNTPYIRLVKFQLVREIPDVYVSACVLAGKLFLLFFLVLLYFS